MPRYRRLLSRGAGMFCRLLLFVAALTSFAHGQDGWSYYAKRALQSYATGDYADAEEYCERIMSFGANDPNLTRVLIDSETAQGKYKEAAENALKAASSFEGHYASQVVAITALRNVGKLEEAHKILNELNELARKANPKTLNAEELTALGRAALYLGAEPKMVLANFFQKARQKNAAIIDGHLAAAEVALSKADYALASRILHEARSKIGSYPEILYLLAKAFSPSDREKSEKLLSELFEINPNHVPALLLRAEHAMDNEEYERAREIIATSRKTNPNHPQGWAYEAAIAYLQDEEKEGDKARAKALLPWDKNPDVDFWIGHKLSQNRRFEEGAGYLRKALTADPNFLRAKKELGQDLLRLGKEEEGWKLIKEVQAKDKYDVETYNLMLLHDELQKFVSLEAEGFLVRMTPREAKVYGPQVLNLLEDARKKLGEKYGFVPEGNVVIDFYPDQQDFAIRTLGMPGGLGILGACFGNVIVMNSPGSLGAMGTNWESTLWHEYCHTITLGATRNRIPRWLTEGISVHEERNRDASCGHKMTPEFRRRILNKEEDDPGLIPIASLSAALTAFNQPGTIDFAYYQSSILVEYLLETFGKNSFQRVLKDLRTNAAAEKVLAKRMASIKKLDEGFAKYARKLAAKVAPKADWTLPDPDSPLHRDPEGVANYLEDNPNNLWALSMRSRFLLSEKKWGDARKVARKLIEIYPEFIGPGNGYFTVALASRNLEDTEAERSALRSLVQRDGDASDALDRLIEIDLSLEDWSAVEDDARRLLAINPLLRSPHRALGIAAQEQEQAPAAIQAFESLLGLDPVNPADVHFRLASLHQPAEPEKARRHVLEAIAEAPRFREAHTLLLKLAPPEAEDKPKPDSPDDPLGAPLPEKPTPSPETPSN